MESDKEPEDSALTEWTSPWKSEQAITSTLSIVVTFVSCSSKHSMASSFLTGDSHSYGLNREHGCTPPTWTRQQGSLVPLQSSFVPRPEHRERWKIPSSCPHSCKYLNPVSDACSYIVIQGGDHTITLPLLRGVAEIYGPVSVIHFDSHLGKQRSIS